LNLDVTTDDFNVQTNEDDESDCDCDLCLSALIESELQYGVQMSSDQPEEIEQCQKANTPKEELISSLPNELKPVADDCTLYNKTETIEDSISQPSTEKNCHLERCIAFSNIRVQCTIVMPISVRFVLGLAFTTLTN